jgi:hypothetical protein
MVAFAEIPPARVQHVAARRSLSVATIRAMVDLYNAGSSIRAIAARHGIDRSKIREVLIDLGVYVAAPAIAWDELETHEFVGMYGTVPTVELSDYFLRDVEHLQQKASALGISNYNPYDTVTLTDRQRMLILASLLGNATMYRSKSGRKHPAIEFTHNNTELDYLAYKHQILKNLAQPSGIQRRTRQTYTYHRFVTRYSPVFEEIYQITRRHDRQRVTGEWLAEITDPFALAIWFMDVGDIQTLYQDKALGTVRGHTLRLYLHVKSRDEAVLIRDWLDREWGIDLNANTWRQTRSGHDYHALSRSVPTVVREFVALVEPHVIPAMRHKIACVR